ncbi:sugar phosphate isomerase/epimerase [Flavobacteriaceae bacterium F89]|uniref:Sugar phosphate isomerase/epimerase n=1 Tax=Cerina litoralis TaxID=2874477 RepID=A0AAE3EUX8_9FLAO|nr:sugar phosphate isomerase/epimerase [Cerina litoralis]MCG2460758.1 sugar phosphate isomerase/epimerase [Cerina litoralis]
MNSRREFLLRSGALAVGTALMPSFTFAGGKKLKGTSNIGVQLYTFRKAMGEDAVGTLKKIAALGIKEIESAGSNKGYYYGLKPKEMQQVCKDLGMTLRSGHIALNDKWEQTLDDAAEAGQEYLICSSMPSKGQSVDNYKKVAASFNKAGEESKKRGIKFGYHNHDYEFESDNGHVLYDVLMDNTQADLVHMELDLGWVVASGNDPMVYFAKYPGRFPLWHLKDMDMAKHESTEFGKGGLDIVDILKHQKESGLKYYFVEQEEYTNDPWDSMKENIAYLKRI